MRLATRIKLEGAFWATCVVACLYVSTQLLTSPDSPARFVVRSIPEGAAVGVLGGTFWLLSWMVCMWLVERRIRKREFKKRSAS
jgi:hypothetical protein